MWMPWSCVLGPGSARLKRRDACRFVVSIGVDLVSIQPGSGRVRRKVESGQIALSTNGLCGFLAGFYGPSWVPPEHEVKPHTGGVRTPAILPKLPHSDTAEAARNTA